MNFSTGGWLIEGRPKKILIMGDHLFLNFIFFWQLLLINRGALLILTWHYIILYIYIGESHTPWTGKSVLNQPALFRVLNAVHVPFFFRGNGRNSVTPIGSGRWPSAKSIGHATGKNRRCTLTALTLQEAGLGHS